MAVLCFSFAAYAEETPAPSEVVTPAPGAPIPAVTAPAKPMSDVDKLKDQIQRLEDKLTKMEEENDIRRRLETTEEEKHRPMKPSSRRRGETTL